MNVAKFKRGPDRDTFEASRRAAATEVLELARGYLENTRVKRSLGHFATELSEISHMAEVPNVIDGHVQPLPDYLERDVFSFTVMQKSETLCSTMAECSPLQQRSFMRRAAEIDPSTTLELPVYTSYELTMPKGYDGATWGLPDEWDGHEGLSCAVRPFVGIRPASRRLMALTAVHEFSHVYDALTKPLSNQPHDVTQLETELKAYTIGHKVNILNGGHTDTLSAEVAALRQRHNGPLMGEGAFRASDAVRQALIKHDLGYIWG